MKILFERTGGFAGLKLQRAFDSEDLPPGEAKRFHALLKNSRILEMPEIAGPVTSGVDRYRYKLTIENDEGVRTVEAAETSLSDAMRPLIEWLTRMRLSRPRS